MASRLVAIGLATAALVCSSGGARADAPVKEDAFWLSMRAGATLLTTLSLDGGVNNIGVNGDDGAAPTWGVGVHYRIGRFDLGLMLENVGAGSFTTAIGQYGLAGGQTRLGFTARARPLDVKWGGMHIRLTPGLSFLQHSEELRIAAADMLGLPEEDATAIESFDYAFSIGIAVGVVVYLADWALLTAELELLTTIATLGEGADTLDLVAFQPVFLVGLEAEL